MNAPTTIRPTARQLLEAQRDQLLAAIKVGTDPFDLTHANRLLKRSNTWLQMTDKALDAARGLIGANGWQPGVDAVCRALWWSARIDGETSLKDDFADFHKRLDDAEAWLKSGRHRFTTPVPTRLGVAFVDGGL